MEPISILLAGGTLIAIIGGYLLLSKSLNKKQQSAELTSRISGKSASDEVFSGEQMPSDLADDENESALAQSLEGLAGAVMSLLGKDPEKEKAKLNKKRRQAGIESANFVGYFLFYKYIGRFVVVLLTLPYLTSNAEDPNYLLNMTMGMILLVIGLFGHTLYLKNKIDKRKKVLTRSFPDTLDLLLVCVESGLALDAAIAKVCSELGAAHPEITDELNRTRMELVMMSDRAKAIYMMGERINITAFKALAAALIQSEKFGTSLADTLRVMADDYRQTRLLEAENKANRLPALMTVPLITMLLPAMFIIIMAPAMIGVARSGAFSD